MWNYDNYRFTASERELNIIKQLVYWNDLRLARKRQRASRYEASFGMDKEELSRFVRQIMANSDNFFIPQRHCDNFAINQEMRLSFQSPVQTQNSVNNTVYTKYIPPAKASKKPIMKSWDK
ncbi:hypothetical protein H8E77_23525 [bacterium]|nr:hypothetical protein [bacterium]